MTVATPSAPTCTWSLNPANPPVLDTVRGRPAPTGADWVTDGSVGALEGGVLPVPASLPHPVSTSPAITATVVYLLKFLTHKGYTQGGRSLQL
ncbi:hypothetical protein GCM10009630_29160 [Kribbella jejuensis]